jgi:hypothetical protein
MSQLRKRTALDPSSLGTIIKRTKPSDQSGNVQPIFIVTSQLSITDGFPPLVQYAVGGIALYEHWAIEVGGRYYELHRGVGQMWKGCHISTEDTVESTTRVVKDGCREIVGYTHDAEQTLRSKGTYADLAFLLTDEADFLPPRTCCSEDARTRLPFLPSYMEQLPQLRPPLPQDD